ncbi:MAG: hypothetical protein H0V43_11880 [Gemmatimonadales bacterium]|nr:hypothetical protein [Gemmatimonadales bacterium]MBA3553964.1 hypothetical protein [Gemmatimonadales bacterium]
MSTTIDRPVPTSPSLHSYGEFLAALLGDRDVFFDEVVAGVELSRKLRFALITLVVLGGLYGGVAGAYSGPPQAVAAAVKLPFLFLATFAVCFPAFYVVQVLVGSRLRLLQVVVLVTSALALTTVVLAAFVPVPAFFLITGANYYFQHLLHIGVVGAAGIFGMYALHDGLTTICERRGVYPRKALTIMRLWAVLFGFVGIQMAWNLRPFLGDRNQPFHLIGRYQGNFYAAVIYAVKQLGADSDSTEQRGDSPAARDLEELLRLGDSARAPGARP